MKTTICLIAAASALTAGSVSAGGIERTSQSAGILFEKGRVAEISAGTVSPTLSGTDLTGSASGNVAKDFRSFGFAYKADLNDRLSWAVILDQPFGADVSYPAGASVLLGGTAAKADARALTALMRYQMGNGFSVHGGLRLQQSSASVTLGGAAYGGLSGYHVTLDRDTALGYVAGAAWERPEIAARVALTYNSEISHSYTPHETFSGGATTTTATTKVKTPRSLNLEFQTGVAADTLLFGSVRWVKWSEFRLDPQSFVGASGGGLINLEDSTTWTLGVGRKFSETWAGSASLSYEKAGSRLVSPLAPSAGRLGATLAAVYTRDAMKITTGINYTRLGDASPQTANTARANFTGGKAIGVGMKVAFSF
ncbi:outer membrane protein transport protein [Falsigemmobacter faecalis]|uniref:Aromatic hydrocarbon degradation protein n=1 Tax=Falsigemmobacter faecalis TaxID=2488730 RepID=A0A3P3DLL2_9RHOB|nr:outer membrane protein transport protein [Falsigemmobacter faecalis]RRH75130.1 hypothetical protein EG244_09095 [Falsigemmobacter faecalis]